MTIQILLLGAFLAAGPAWAADEDPPVPVPTPAPTPTPQGRLDLGPYGNVPPPVLLDVQPGAVPRFKEEIEVPGKAMDSAALTARLEWWFRDTDLTRGATPATLSAPSLLEMRDHRVHPTDAVDFVALLKALAEKLGHDK